MFGQIKDEPYSSFGCSGVPSTVRPMKSRSTLRMRPASSLPFKFNAFFALDGELKVIVATSMEDVAELWGQREIFDVVWTSWRSKKW